MTVTRPDAATVRASRCPISDWCMVDSHTGPDTDASRGSGPRSLARREARRDGARPDRGPATPRRGTDRGGACACRVDGLGTGVRSAVGILYWAGARAVRRVFSDRARQAQHARKTKERNRRSRPKTSCRRTGPHDRRCDARIDDQVPSPKSSRETEERRVRAPPRSRPRPPAGRLCAPPLPGPTHTGPSHVSHVRYLSPSSAACGAGSCRSRSSVWPRRRPPWRAACTRPGCRAGRRRARRR